MTTLEELWPPYRLHLRLGDLELRLIRDEDFPELVELVRSGIHPPERMPFTAPWTDLPASDVARNFAQFHWLIRSRFSPETFSLDFVVRRAGVVVGTQGLHTVDFAVVRTGETGSWLAARHQGQGIGTRMRQAVCAFAFDVLGAQQITSGAFTDNPVSRAVSLKVGYRDNGIERQVRRGEPAVSQKLLLRPEWFVRPAEELSVHGADDLLVFLGLEPADQTRGCNGSGDAPAWIRP